MPNPNASIAPAGAAAHAAAHATTSATTSAAPSAATPAEFKVDGADEVLVLTAHPQLDNSRVNRRLMRAALDRIAGGATCRVRDLYALYPDYLIDVEAEQQLLLSARLIVWQHPIHWYGMPPLMKLWLDDVLAYGWAYGPGGGLLRGKDLWLVATTGGPEESYRPDGHNRYFFDAFLPPYEQTAALCGLRFLPPLVMHGAHRATDAELQAHEDIFVQRLGSYPRWPEIESLAPQVACEVPTNARPADAEDV